MCGRRWAFEIQLPWFRLVLLADLCSARLLLGVCAKVAVPDTIRCAAGGGLYPFVTWELPRPHNLASQASALEQLPGPVPETFPGQRLVDLFERHKAERPLCREQRSRLRSACRPCTRGRDGVSHVLPRFRGHGVE